MSKKWIFLFLIFAGCSHKNQTDNSLLFPLLEGENSHVFDSSQNSNSVTGSSKNFSTNIIYEIVEGNCGNCAPPSVFLGSKVRHYLNNTLPLMAKFWLVNGNENCDSPNKLYARNYTLSMRQGVDPLAIQYKECYSYYFEVNTPYPDDSRFDEFFKKQEIIPIQETGSYKACVSFLSNCICGASFFWHDRTISNWWEEKNPMQRSQQIEITENDNQKEIIVQLIIELPNGNMNYSCGRHIISYGDIKINIVR